VTLVRKISPVPRKRKMFAPGPRNQPPSCNNIDKFVTGIHKESVKGNRGWSDEDRAEERERLVTLKLSGFTDADSDTLSKEFIVAVSWRFPDLRLDADAVTSPVQQQLAKTRDRAVIKVTLMDYERLHKDQWFNDRLMNFWRVWLQHGPAYDREAIDFYDSLQFETPRLKKSKFDNVKKNLNPFAKKMVLIMLNAEGGWHWNVAVLLNLDQVSMRRVGQTKDLTSRMPCMLLLDSCRCDTSGVLEHQLIVAWLQRKEPSLDVTKAMIPLFVPPVLQQEDSSSCGALSVLNAHSMIRLHKQAFTHQYAGVNPTGELLKGHGEPFEHMVKKSLEFACSLADVDRILNEMRCLINELSTKQRQGA
jgi:hypothetical protein